MRCPECGSIIEKSVTTSVTDLGDCLVIVRNVPCYKCTECNEILYTGDVVEKLEKIIEIAKKMMQEISVVDYSKVAQKGVREITIQQKIDMALAYAGNVTKKDIADKLGVTPSAFGQRLKTGKFTNEELEIIASVFDAEYISFFRFKDGKEIQGKAVKKMAAFFI